MSRWLPPVLALAVGALVAAAALFSPVAAFAVGAAATWVALLRAARRPSPPATAPTRELPPDAARALLATLPTPLLLVTRTGRVAFANPAVRAAMPRLQPGGHFAHLIRAPAFVEAMTATLADGAERRVRFLLHQKGERAMEARIGLLPAGGIFGTEALALVELDDRTEARRAEQLRSDFVANASHELRTPLASIVGYIETLQHHARDDAAARERFLGIMAREAGRMQRLVDDLLSLGRIEMSEHLRPDSVVSLEDAAAESAAALLPVAAAAGVRLAVDLAAGGSPVKGDADQLAQVFTNLIDNALKHGGPDGTVRVARADAGRAGLSRVGISVIDDGPGIAREHLPRLTERFYRVSVASSRTRGGTGLGLAIVKHILNRHEGRLEIASTPGQGSRFTVWLPPA